MAKRKIPLPTSISVIGKRYRVVKIAPSSDGSYGECLEEQQEIRLKPGLPLEQEQDTLLHEIIHAIDFSMNAKMSERQITVLATGLICVLKENRDFLAYLELE